MSKQIFVLLVILVSSICTFAQTDNYNAPVKWERYKVSDKEFSILLPKMPTLISFSDVCGQVEGSKYTVYAENIVYGFNITAKLKQKPPGFCKDVKEFDEQKSFAERIKEIKSDFVGTERETKLFQNKLEGLKITNDTFTYWFIKDFENGRWFEIWAANADETDAVVKNFIESIEIGKNPSGIEIGDGSFRTLGDETGNNIDEPVDMKTAIADKETVKIKFIVKPKASYTDVARQKNVEGVVQLRLTLLASGGIGPISPVKTLPYGLTEQAIAAAAKIAFIPAKRNGVTYSVTSIVEYHFSIY